MFTCDLYYVQITELCFLRWVRSRSTADWSCWTLIHIWYSEQLIKWTYKTLSESESERPARGVGGGGWDGVGGCGFVDLLPQTGWPSRGGDVAVYVLDRNQPSLSIPFCSLLVSVSVFIALSTVFHSINSPDNSSLSHSVLPVLFSALLVLSSLYLFTKVPLCPPAVGSCGRRN